MLLIRAYATIVPSLNDLFCVVFNNLNNEAMNQNVSYPADELQSLETKLDVLINQYKHIKVENVSLKTKQDTLVREKAKLLEKTTLARTQVEAMINRLKAMEQNS